MKNLRTVRLSKGLSQQALGKKTGLTQAAISYIESGQHDPKYSTILRLAVCLGVDPEQLIASPSAPAGPAVAAAPRADTYA